MTTNFEFERLDHELRRDGSFSIPLKLHVVVFAGAETAGKRKRKKLIVRSSELVCGDRAFFF